MRALRMGLQPSDTGCDLVMLSSSRSSLILRGTKAAQSGEGCHRSLVYYNWVE